MNNPQHPTRSSSHNLTIMSTLALLATAGVFGTALVGYAIGGFLGFCITAVLFGGLAIGGTQAIALLFLDASDKRQTVAAARAHSKHASSVPQRPTH